MPLNKNNKPRGQTTKNHVPNTDDKPRGKTTKKHGCNLHGQTKNNRFHNTYENKIVISFCKSDIENNGHAAFEQHDSIVYGNERR